MALFPIDVIDNGIDICVNDVHPLNVYGLISVTENGIDICLSE